MIFCRNKSSESKKLAGQLDPRAQLPYLRRSTGRTAGPNWWLGFRGLENHTEICVQWPCQRRFLARGSTGPAPQAPELSGQYQFTEPAIKY